jgi:hypothetical protein
MRVTGVLAAALALAGCGGDEASAQLVGDWRLVRADGCLVALRFESDGGYAHAVGCQLESGEVGVERHEGTYAASSGRYEVELERSTCADAPRLLEAVYEIRGDRLFLDLSATRLIFERDDVGGGDGSTVILYGCWDGDTLDVSELRPL